MLKAVILIGGPQKGESSERSRTTHIMSTMRNQTHPSGTRFRPLSLDIPKPLFPVAGRPIIQHHIEACAQLPQLKEILILGFYPATQMEQFVDAMQQLYPAVGIRYLQEFTSLGTAGGMYHFRDQIRAGAPEAFFVLNGDVCADFPLRELYKFHRQRSTTTMAGLFAAGAAELTILTTEATKQQSVHYGCLVMDAATGAVDHYVEKPGSYVSTYINCGVYVASVEIFARMAAVFRSREHSPSGGSPTYGGGGGASACNGNGGRDQGHIMWEREIIRPLAGTGRLFAMPSTRWWSQIKTAGAAIYANRHYLQLYGRTHPERLARQGVAAAADGRLQCTVLPDVHIHPSATVHPTATVRLFV